MKIKENTVLTEVAGGFLLVDAGRVGDCFRGMIKMNGTGAFIVRALEQETTREAIVSAILAEYETTEDAAGKSVDSVLSTLREAGLLLE